jgi:signal transduction histidine kinase
MVVIDRNIIRRIILALLWNSVAATENGTLSVLVNWSSSNGYTISVKDTGIGIPASDAERVFEIFWKGKSQVQPLGSGCGIGLAMARALALLMKGSLSLVASSAQGSTFDLQIPQHLSLCSDATNQHD